mgnify:CR=1 FL=1
MIQKILNLNPEENQCKSGCPISLMLWVTTSGRLKPKCYDPQHHGILPKQHRFNVN